MLTIDGSIGEGGGQILRSALALALCTGEPFRIVNIRAHRSRPGLCPQHLACVHAAARISNARVTGAALDATELTFVPQPVRSGDYEFSIGTAGSAVLVLQTLIPALILADGASTLRLEGGTHNPQAPTYDFLARAFLPLVERMGPKFHIELLRPGFYPQGGGRIKLEIDPASRLLPLQLESRGELKSLTAEILMSRLPRHVGDRETAVLAKNLPLEAASISVRNISDSLSPGNAVTVFCVSEQITDVFAAVGQRGVPAETVANEAVQATKRYLDADVPVGEHLADQLLVPLALAGAGSFVTLPPSRHTNTNIRVIEQFLGIRVRCGQIAATDRWCIALS